MEIIDPEEQLHDDLHGLSSAMSPEDQITHLSQVLNRYFDDPDDGETTIGHAIRILHESMRYRSRMTHFCQLARSVAYAHDSASFRKEIDYLVSTAQLSDRM